MEKSRLRPELQTIVDQFARFRNEYSALKTHHAAQEELISLQKLELEQMNFRVEQLASTLIEYQKRFNTTLNNLESENQRLQKTIDDVNRECENTRVNDNEYILEVHRNNDEYSRRLEEHLDELRSKIASQVENHEEQIKSIERRHTEEISAYKKKFEHMNSSEKRHSEEISAYKKKFEQMNSLQLRHDEEISTYKKKIDHTNKTAQESHPALGEDTGNKRKKFGSSSYRWPQLDVSTKKEVAFQKKKRLYQADNEAIVDLGS